MTELTSSPIDLALEAKIATKIAAVQGEIESVTKHGYNEAQRYKYARTEDMLAMLRPKLSEHHLALLVDTRQWEIDGLFARVLLDVSLLDTETGHSRVCTVLGEGKDGGDKGRGDKAFSKAYTMALKHWARTTWLIDLADDAEAADAPKPAPRPTRQAPTPAPPRAAASATAPPPNHERAAPKNAPELMEMAAAAGADYAGNMYHLQNAIASQMRVWGEMAEGEKVSWNKAMHDTALMLRMLDAAIAHKAQPAAHADAA